jgi:hypothetical protein
MAERDTIYAAGKAGTDDNRREKVGANYYKNIVLVEDHLRYICGAEESQGHRCLS